MPFCTRAPVSTSIPISAANSIYIRTSGPVEEQEIARTLFDRFGGLARAGRFDRIRNLTTPASFEHLSKWIASVGEGQRAAFQQYLGEERRILRVAPMGGVAIVYWVSAEVAQPRMEDLQYSYLDLAGESPRLANINLLDIFDDVLRNNPGVAKWAGIGETSRQ